MFPKQVEVSLSLVVFVSARFNLHLSRLFNPNCSLKVGVCGGGGHGQAWNPQVSLLRVAFTLPPSCSASGT